MTNQINELLCYAENHVLKNMMKKSILKIRKKNQLFLDILDLTVLIRY